MSATRVDTLSDCFNKLEHAMQLFGRGVKAGVTGSTAFTGEAISAAYNLFGKHTFPQTEFRKHPSPKKIVELNKTGLAFLTIVPVLPVTVFLSATLIPLAGNSYQSCINTFVTLVNLSLLDLDEMKLLKNPGPDTRGFFRQLYGLPGLVLGAMAAVPVTNFIAVARLSINTWKTGKHTFNTIANLIYYPHRLGPRLGQDDERHWAWKYGIGFFGLPIGLLAGLAASPALFLCRLLHESSQTAKRTIFSAIKLASYPRTVSLKGLEESDDRYLVEKYLFGGTGLLSGLAIGGIAATSILFGRYLLTTINSWQALSGSLVNGAFNAKLFAGIAGDKRRPLIKTLGGVGYVTALVTTLPAAVAIFTMRQLTFQLVQIAGIIVSPFVLTAKVAARCLRPVPSVTDCTIQKLNNLQASLTVSGNFRACNTPSILGNGLGQESVSTLLRKSVTFNRETRTEKILSTFRAKYRKFLLEQSKLNEQPTHENKLQRILIANAGGPHLGLQTVADKVKKSVIDDYMDQAYFCAGTERIEEQKEINRIVDFILAYLINDDSKPGPSATPIPTDLYTKKSWFSVFQGKTDEDKTNGSQLYFYPTIPDQRAF